MRQILLGRPVARFVPLPVEMTPRANWKPFSSPAALREVPFVPTPQHVVDELRIGERRVVQAQVLVRRALDAHCAAHGQAGVGDQGCEALAIGRRGEVFDDGGFGTGRA